MKKYREKWKRSFAVILALALIISQIQAPMMVKAADSTPVIEIGDATYTMNGTDYTITEAVYNENNRSITVTFDKDLPICWEKLQLALWYLNDSGDLISQVGRTFKKQSANQYVSEENAVDDNEDIKTVRCGWNSYDTSFVAGNTHISVANPHKDYCQCECGYYDGTDRAWHSFNSADGTQHRCSICGFTEGHRWIDDGNGQHKCSWPACSYTKPHTGGSDIDDDDIIECEICRLDYKLEEPVFYPSADGYAGGLITITAAEGASIYYTTDGSEPTMDSTEYAAPFIPTAFPVTIKAIAGKDGLQSSEVATATYEYIIKETVPTATIDYINEKLTGLVAGAKYTVNAKEYTADSNGNINIDNSWIGTTIAIIKIASDTYHIDSEAQSLAIPSRPAVQNVQGVNTSYADTKDGKIFGVTAAMEYRKGTSSSWAPCVGTEVTGLEAGTYEVRVKATDRSFASLATKVTVSVGPARTYTLTVTAPTFDNVDYGYAQPEAKPLTITSSGNSDASIASVTVDSTDFIIKAGTANVEAGKTNETYTIQPKAGLDVGVYSAAVTVTYQNGTETAAATCNVTITVNKVEQQAPVAPTIASHTADSITLTTTPDSTVSGAKAEYSKDNGSTWQDSPVFKGLKETDTCNFVVRYKAVANYNASDNSDVLTTKIPHSYTNSVTKEANCKEKGIRTYTCSCGDSYTEEIAINPDNHALQYHEAQAPTYTKIGWEAYDECTRTGCDYTTYVEIPKLVDDIAPVIVGITNGKIYCEKQTFTVEEKNIKSVTVNGTEVTATDGIYTLAAANTEYVIVVTDKAGNTASVTVTVNDGHTFTDYVSNEDASCTADGTKTAKCDYCDAKETIADEGSKHPHTMIHSDKVEATCVSKGNVEYWHCSECDKNYDSAKGESVIADVVTPVNPNSHDLKHHEAKAPTYTEIGWEAYDTCSRCDYTTYVELPKLVETKPEEPKPVEPTTPVEPEKPAEPETPVLTDEEYQGTEPVKVELIKKIKSAKTYNKIYWDKVKGADGYYIYASPCNTKKHKNPIKKIKDITSGKTTSFTHKGLKKGTWYKYRVVAYQISDGRKVTIAQSFMLHAVTLGGKYVNPGSVKVNKSKVSIKKGKSFTVKAKVVLAKGKKTQYHTKKIHFISSNTKIATVNSKGKIRAKKKGRCTIYAIAQNGVSKKIKVTVK